MDMNGSSFLTASQLMGPKVMAYHARGKDAILESI